MNKLKEMFWCFFKIGAFTLGGGYAMIPLIEKEIVENKKWLNKEEFMDVMVVSQSFPGALAVNCATFLGYKISGLIGALVALLSVILPSFTIILVIAAYFMQSRSNYYVNAIFLGITAIIPLLVLSGAISLGKGVERNKSNVITGGIALILLVVFDINPSLLIILGAVYGIVFLREKV